MAPLARLCFRNAAATLPLVTSPVRDSSGAWVTSLRRADLFRRALMKRLRPVRWSGPLLWARPRAAITRPLLTSTVRCQYAATLTEATSVPVPENNESEVNHEPASQRSLLPPSHEKALSSAKLAALHARLLLPKNIPLQTLARTLITSSADPDSRFNNANLAYLGSTLINYHVCEFLVCKWPRLPVSVMYESLRAYSGPESLHHVACRWGVEAAVMPGQEVDPGLLQWSADKQLRGEADWAYVRQDVKHIAKFRRGISSRIVLDDDFGDMLLPKPGTTESEKHYRKDKAFASFVQAVVGSVHTHCGREAAKTFINSHILARSFDPSVLFQFHLPTRELSWLCAREGFEPPLARLESETGRATRTPVYVVGIYSGNEKLGEGAGPSLDIARRKACIMTLKAWYLYSPGNKVPVPSDMMAEDAKPWKAPHIDIGEII